MGSHLAHALIEFAEQHQIPIAKDKRGEAPFSVDANLLHASSEGKVLEDPAQEVPDYVYSRTIDPEDAPDKPTYRHASTSSAATPSRSTARRCRRRRCSRSSTSSAAPTASAGSISSRTASSA